MSKPITSAAVMILADRGVIDLQDSVASYIPEFAGQMVSENGQRFQPAGGITLRNLMNMTSGLVYRINYSEKWMKDYIRIIP